MEEYRRILGDNPHPPPIENLTEPFGVKEDNEGTPWIKVIPHHQLDEKRQMESKESVHTIREKIEAAYTKTQKKDPNTPKWENLMGHEMSQLDKYKALRKMERDKERKGIGWGSYNQGEKGEDELAEEDSDACDDSLYNDKTKPRFNTFRQAAEHAKLIPSFRDKKSVSKAAAALRNIEPPKPEKYAHPKWGGDSTDVYTDGAQMY
ncbi:hypothetical protein AAMO2058_001392200 [Amorphochlora amoebiformis]